MNWATFIIGSPIVLLGFAWQFVCDMFDRGKRAYDWMQS